MRYKGARRQWKGRYGVGRWLKWYRRKTKARPFAAVDSE